MSGRLKGKVAMVTGGASGIGRATVERFVQEGARVVIADMQDDKGERMEEALGKSVRYIHADVTHEADVKAACDLAAKAYGGLDILYNNAGSGGPMEFADTVTAEGFDSVMHLHVRAAFFGMKHAAPLMREKGGAVVSTASVAGLENGYGPILYSVAKAAIIHLTRVAAVQLAPWNIRVNCVCPGAIATAIFGRALGQATQLADQTARQLETAMEGVQPLRRSGLPEDIAEGVIYLASDAAKFVTGHALVIDGGLTCGPYNHGQSPFADILKVMGLDPADLQALATAR
ncbi:MAG: SDR family oxidoreductase [Alphaproteobacteria bacterium]|nr:SDR family oxidoreductase [Alphaproteobacteria bacterium]